MVKKFLFGMFLASLVSLAFAQQSANYKIEQGTVIGKALEPLESGTGLIKVLVMLR